MSKIVEQARAMAKQVRFEDSEHIPNTDVFKESADLIDALAEKVEKLEKDAERYRWLREYGEPDKGLAYRSDFTWEMYDQAIDAAMETTK